MANNETFLRTIPTAYPLLQGKDGAAELIVSFSEYSTVKALGTTSGGVPVIKAPVYLMGKKEIIQKSFGDAVKPGENGNYYVEIEFYRKDAERIDQAASKARNKQGEYKRRVRLNVTGALHIKCWTGDDGAAHTCLELANAWLGDVQPVIAYQEGAQYPNYGAPQGNGAPQGGFAPNGAPQWGYNPNGAPQGGFNPNGAPQGGFNPNGAPQGGYNPNGAPQGSYNQNSVPQGGNAANRQGSGNAAANGYAPQGGTYAPPAPQNGGDFHAIDDDDGDLPF